MIGGVFSQHVAEACLIAAMDRKGVDVVNCLILVLFFSIKVQYLICSDDIFNVCNSYTNLAGKDVKNFDKSLVCFFRGETFSRFKLTSAYPADAELYKMDV